MIIGNFLCFVSERIWCDFDCTWIYEQVAELRAAIGPLSGRRLKYCTDACLRRYLEARNWNVDKAKKMLEESLKWRSTYKPEEIRWVSLIYLTLAFTYSIVIPKLLYHEPFIIVTLIHAINNLTN